MKTIIKIGEFIKNEAFIFGNFGKSNRIDSICKLYQKIIHVVNNLRVFVWVLGIPKPFYVFIRKSIKDKR